MEAGIVFAEHDGTKLIGDLYLPNGRSKAPVLVAVHGGGWQVGARAFYRIGVCFSRAPAMRVLASNTGWAKPGTYPAAVYDMKAAVQFVRAKAGEFDLDPDRIGADRRFRRRASCRPGRAGGRSVHVCPIVTTPTPRLPPTSRCLIGFYGVYDMLRAVATTIFRPVRVTGSSRNSSALSPTQNRRLVFRCVADQLCHRRSQSDCASCSIHGTDDDIVDPPASPARS